MENLPTELMEEIIMNMPLKEVLERRELSKEWRDVIDNLWCRLLKRDYNIKQKDDCKNKYVLLNDISIPKKKINSVLKKVIINNIDSIVDLILVNSGFKEEKDKWIFKPNIERDMDSVGNSLDSRGKFVPKFNLRISNIGVILMNINIDDDYNIIVKIIENILPRYFFIEHNEYISIMIKDYITIYNINYSFDNDLLSLLANPPEKTFYRWISMKPNVVLNLIHEIANYKGSNLRQFRNYLANKYRLRELTIKDDKEFMVTVINEDI